MKMIRAFTAGCAARLREVARCSECPQRSPDAQCSASWPAESAQTAGRTVRPRISSRASLSNPRRQSNNESMMNTHLLLLQKGMRARAALHCLHGTAGRLHSAARARRGDWDGCHCVLVPLLSFGV